MLVAYTRKTTPDYKSLFPDHNTSVNILDENGKG